MTEGFKRQVQAEPGKRCCLYDLPLLLMPYIALQRIRISDYVTCLSKIPLHLTVNLKSDVVLYIIYSSTHLQPQPPCWSLTILPQAGYPTHLQPYQSTSTLGSGTVGFLGRQPCPV